MTKQNEYVEIVEELTTIGRLPDTGIQEVEEYLGERICVLHNQLIRVLDQTNLPIN